MKQELNRPVKIPDDMHREIKTISAIEKKYMGEYLEMVYKEWKVFKAKEKEQQLKK